MPRWRVAMKVDKKNVPQGTRFLYRGFLSTSPREDFLVEWSPSGMYVHLKNQGWMTSEDVFRFELLEILPNQKQKEEDLCPNCVTLWKCNGPHIIEQNK